MSDEDLFRKSEELLYSFNDLRNKVLDDGADPVDRRRAAIKIKKINNAMNVLDEKEVDYVTKRYFLGMSWYAICKSAGYKSDNTKGIQKKCKNAVSRIVQVLLPGEYYGIW